jgi:iron(III) transport system substrate-binding protein
MRRQGAPVAQVIPDQGEGRPGLILLPNTVAILAKAPRVDNARRFVDFLVSADNERFLAETNVQIPFHPGVPRPPEVIDPARARLMAIDFEAVGRGLPAAQKALQELFLD